MCLVLSSYINFRGFINEPSLIMKSILISIGTTAREHADSVEFFLLQPSRTVY